MKTTRPQVVTVICDICGVEDEGEKLRLFEHSAVLNIKCNRVQHAKCNQADGGFHLDLCDKCLPDVVDRISDMFKALPRANTRWTK